MPAAAPAPPTISTVAPAAAPTPTPHSPSTAADAADAEEPAAAATAHDPATSKAAQPRGLVYDHRGWGDAEALELAATIRAEPSKFADVTLLDLSYNEALGDAGLRAIGEAMEAGALPSLESLVLRGCRALTALPPALGRIETLSSLDLFWCANRRTLSRLLLSDASIPPRSRLHPRAPLEPALHTRTHARTHARGAQVRLSRRASRSLGAPATANQVPTDTSRSVGGGRPARDESDEG